MGFVIVGAWLALIVWFVVTVYRAPPMDFTKTQALPRVGDPVQTISRNWYVSGGLLFVAASVAALLVLAYLPEFAAWWLQ